MTSTPQKSPETSRKSSSEEEEFEKVDTPDLEPIPDTNEASTPTKISPINITILLDEICELKKKMCSQDQKIVYRDKKIEKLEEELSVLKQESEEQYWQLKHLRKEKLEISKNFQNFLEKIEKNGPFDHLLKDLEQILKTTVPLDYKLQKLDLDEK